MDYRFFFLPLFFILVVIVSSLRYNGTIYSNSISYLL